MIFGQPWWEVVLVGAAGLIVGGVLLIIALIAFSDWRSGRRRRSPQALSEREVKQMLSFPYYVDGGGLRTVSGSLGIELPLSREITRARKFGLSYKGLTGEGSRVVTAQLAGQIDLNRLAHELRFGVAAKRVASELGEAPYVSDEEVLESAINTIERGLGETSVAREALARVRETYEEARVERVVDTKRKELKAAADANSLIFLSGEFDRAPDTEGVANTLRLTRFDLRQPHSSGEAMRWVETRHGQMEIVHVVRQMDDFEAFGRRPATRDEAIVPAEVSIQVVLPDDSALTPAGAERIGRGQPFYSRVIAHSPSYDPGSGSFVCSAYAVWGVTRA